jgi:hypothetical protein
MAGMTGPVPVVRFGVPGGNDQPVAYPVGTTQQLYYGEVALLSGSGAVTAGYLKNAATPGSADLVVGMVGEPAGGTAVETGTGIVGGSTDGAVWDNVQTGAFFFQSGTGADQLSEATAGKTVYLGNETTSGPVAMATSASSTRPILGVQLPQDPGIAGGFTPGANYWPVVLNQVPRV